MDIDKSINQIQETIIKPKEPYLIPSKDNLLERFKFAYEFIQKKFNLKHSIKPCEAVKLVYGVKDGWKSLLYSLTIEVLRVVDNDREKAFEILKLYYENSEKKSGRTLERIKRQIDYTLRKDKFKVSCEYRINHFDCIGVENCKIVRGYKKKRCNKMDKREFQEFVNSQINAYLTNLRETGLITKLSPEAFKIYTYLLELKFLRGFEWIFISYIDLYKVLKVKYTKKIRLYLNELRDNALIVYDVEKPSFKEKKAVAIRVLNLFKDPINRIDEMLS
jgi:hypothetical protein